MSGIHHSQNGLGLFFACPRNAEVSESTNPELPEHDNRWRGPGNSMCSWPGRKEDINFM
jgi:hypothetical protein